MLNRGIRAACGWKRHTLYTRPQRFSASPCVPIRCGWIVFLVQLNRLAVQLNCLSSMPGNPTQQQHGRSAGERHAHRHIKNRYRSNAGDMSRSSSSGARYQKPLIWFPLAVDSFQRRPHATNCAILRESYATRENRCCKRDRCSKDRWERKREIWQCRIRFSANRMLRPSICLALSMRRPVISHSADIALVDTGQCWPALSGSTIVDNTAALLAARWKAAEKFSVQTNRWRLFSEERLKAAPCSICAIE